MNVWRDPLWWCCFWGGISAALGSWPLAGFFWSFAIIEAIRGGKE